MHELKVNVRPYKGEPGVSPIVRVDRIEGGYRVVFTDVEGEKAYTISTSDIAPATNELLGGVKVGDNLEVDSEGLLSAVSDIVSVNGKTGAVVLNAADVGARPDTWMPTAEDVGAKPADWEPDIPEAPVSSVNGKTGDVVIKAEDFGVVHPNLLDNWYFADPVNQRGETLWLGMDYGIDRWMFGGAEIMNGGISIQHGMAFAQRTEFNPTGRVVTFSVLHSDGELSTATGVWDGMEITDGDFVFTFGWRSNSIAPPRYARILNNSPTDKLVRAVKLELGAQQTLAHQEGGKWVLNEVPKYSDILAQCQRYYWSVTGGALVSTGFITSEAKNYYIDASFLPRNLARYASLNFGKIIARGPTGYTKAFPSAGYTPDASKCGITYDNNGNVKNIVVTFDTAPGDTNNTVLSYQIYSVTAEAEPN